MLPTVLRPRYFLELPALVLDTARARQSVTAHAKAVLDCEGLRHLLDHHRHLLAVLSLLIVRLLLTFEHHTGVAEAAASQTAISYDLLIRDGDVASDKGQTL